MIVHGGSFSLYSPDKGIRGGLGDYPQTCPDGPETWVLLCNLMVKHCGLSTIVGSDSSWSNISRPHVRDLGPYSRTSYDIS